MKVCRLGTGAYNRMSTVEILCEGCRLDVELETLRQSPTLEGLRQNSVDPRRIEVPNVAFLTLRKSLEFCEHYRHSSPKEIPRPLPSSNLVECGVDAWDASFIELDSLQELVDLTVCATFLELPGLLVLCCAKLAAITRADRAPQASSSEHPPEAGAPLLRCRY